MRTIYCAFLPPTLLSDYCSEHRRSIPVTGKSLSEIVLINVGFVFHLRDIKDIKLLSKHQELLSKDFKLLLKHWELLSKHWELLSKYWELLSKHW